MTAFEHRAQQLSALLEEKEIDLLLVTNLVNVRYLCGFTGTNGLCLVGPDRRTFVTDFRYVERSRSEVIGYETLQGRQDLLGDVAELLKQTRLPGPASGIRGHDHVGGKPREALEAGARRGRAGAGQRAGGAAARCQGRTGAGRDSPGGDDRRRPLPLADRVARPGRPHRGRDRTRARAAGTGDRGRGRLLPADRRRRGQRRAAARTTPRRGDPARDPGRRRPRLQDRRLLLRLHAHLCHRPARRTTPRRATSWCGGHRPPPWRLSGRAPSARRSTQRRAS